MNDDEELKKHGRKGGHKQGKVKEYNLPTREAVGAWPNAAWSRLWTAMNIMLNHDLSRGRSILLSWLLVLSTYQWRDLPQICEDQHLTKNHSITPTALRQNLSKVFKEHGLHELDWASASSPCHSTTFSQYSAHQAMYNFSNASWPLSFIHEICSSLQTKMSFPSLDFCVCPMETNYHRSLPSLCSDSQR